MMTRNNITPYHFFEFNADGYNTEINKIVNDDNYFSSHTNILKFTVHTRSVHIAWSVFDLFSDTFVHFGIHYAMYFLLHFLLLCPCHQFYPLIWPILPLECWSFLKWETFQDMYLPFCIPVTIVPVRLMTQNGDGSNLVDHLFCFLWRINTVSPTWISEACAFDFWSAYFFICSFACISIIFLNCYVHIRILCHFNLRKFWLILWLNNNSDGTKSVVLWGVAWSFNKNW